MGIMLQLYFMEYLVTDFQGKEIISVLGNVNLTSN